MKILVAVKRVIDPYVKIRVKDDNTGVFDDKSVKHSMNTFCEIALEQALRIDKPDKEIILVSIADENAKDTLRHGLALGADRAILVNTPKQFSSLNIAKILRNISIKIKPDLILMGKQSIDGDNNQTPQMLAGLLNLPQATFASKVEFENNNALVTRELDSGLETISVTLPAVISVDLRLNRPRLPGLPNIMRAKQKPLEVIELDSMGLSLKEHQKTVKVTPPSIRNAGVKLTTIDELVEKLQYEAKVL